MRETVVRVLDRLRQGPAATTIAMGRDPYGVIERLYRRHGDVFTLHVPGGRGAVRVLCEPAAIQRIATATYDEVEPCHDGIDLFLGPEALIMMAGELHRSRRRTIGPGFGAEAVRRFAATMLEVVDEVVARLRPGQQLRAIAPMQEITLRVLMRGIFGLTDHPRFAEMRTLAVEYLRLVFSPPALVLGLRRGFAGARAWFTERGEAARASDPDAPFVPSRRPLLRVADRLGRLHALFAAEIRRCRADGPETRGDVLALLLQVRGEDGAPLADSELHEQLLMLLLAGYETTATSLVWALHAMLRAPGCVDRVRAEVAAVMGEGFDVARVRELKFLGAAIHESMRLYPIATGVARRLRVPMELAGRSLPAGTPVLACAYLGQRDPQVWPEPLVFRPERMLDRKPTALFYPFGAGAWRCLGAAFAEQQMRVVLARLLTQVELAPTAEVRAVMTSITIGPSGGLPVAVVRALRSRS